MKPPLSRQQLVEAAADALQREDWLWAQSVLKRFEYRITPAELVACSPESALAFARGGFEGPWAIIEELRLVLWDGDSKAFLQADPCVLPSIIADKLFSAAIDRAREAVRADQWDQVLAMIELSLSLPGASTLREDVLLSFASRLVDHARLVQQAVGRGERSQPGLFRATLGLSVACAQSTGYSLLTPLFVFDYLKQAERPMLTAFNAGIIVILWSELKGLYLQETRNELVSTARDWLERAICSEPEDEQFAPGEFEEP